MIVSKLLYWNRKRKAPGALCQYKAASDTLAARFPARPKSLVRTQYRKLLEARDGWFRSIIEHAIMSGRTQIFEAVFNAFRRDVHDEKVNLRRLTLDSW